VLVTAEVHDLAGAKERRVHGQDLCVIVVADPEPAADELRHGRRLAPFGDVLAESLSGHDDVADLERAGDADLDLVVAARGAASEDPVHVHVHARTRNDIDDAHCLLAREQRLRDPRWTQSLVVADTDAV
jgi:hypothetical protein